MTALLWVLLGVLIGLPIGALVGYVVADRRERHLPLIPLPHLPEDTAP